MRMKNVMKKGMILISELSSTTSWKAILHIFSLYENKNIAIQNKCGDGHVVPFSNLEEYE